MRWLYFLVLLICLSLPANAFDVLPENYKAYYDSINVAELSVFELNFHRAYDTYSRTFSRFEKRHVNDLHNASLCAILIGEHTQAKEWIM